MHTPLQEIVATLRQGHFVAVRDDPRREGETDLIIAAEKITVAAMAFLIRHTSGIITVPMERQRLRQLGLARFRTKNPTRFGTGFTMSVDLLGKTRGGVSAKERTATVRALIHPKTTPEELCRPGHVFPLEAHPKGLAGRSGHTEASLALVERAQLFPAAVIGELLNDDGSIMRGKHLHTFLQRHQIPLTTIATIIRTQKTA